MKSEREKMVSGQLYLASDKELQSLAATAKAMMDEFNDTKYNDFAKRKEIIHKLFGKVGQNIIINKPLFVDYGFNIEVGDNFYANYGAIILDVTKVKIGNNVMLGPRVSIYTATHPVDPEVRSTLLEYGVPVTIGNNVWIGGDTVINPGVTIGDNVVIGSGSVVTKKIPANVIAAGNPAKVIRALNDNDKAYWQQKAKEHSN